MKKIILNIYDDLQKIKKQSPVIHHLTNWVTIYNCANVTKCLGASPIMAHAYQEIKDINKISSALVLNIGTLTEDFIKSMKIAALNANKRKIPVILDVCGAGASKLRDKSCFSLLNETNINVIKGNYSEIARISGENVKTKGVDSSNIQIDMIKAAKSLASKYNCTVAATGKEDVVCNNESCFIIKNGHPVMADVVGTGCMSTSIIGVFASMSRDYASAAASALSFFEIASEFAAKKVQGPGFFTEHLLYYLYTLDKKTINRKQKIFSH